MEVCYNQVIAMRREGRAIFKVLLVDDEPLVLEGLKFMVDWRSCGFAVCGEASDGESALALVEQLAPALVVTDLRMPLLDGFGLIRRCGEMMERNNARFIILSGHEDFEAARRGGQYHVADYWLKPIDPDEIQETLLMLRRQWDDNISMSAVPAAGSAEKPASLDNGLPEAEQMPGTALEGNGEARVRGRRPSSPSPVDRALKLVQEHYCRPLKLQHIAETLHFQPAYFGQLFKRHVGMSFGDYVHRVRVEEACKLLRGSELNVAEIARTVGYADPELFAVRFKAIKSVLPSQYRK